ncbi:YesL family protein [Brotaphodocola sp.]|uniref:YesL family protein n=1 Tax=Brotaphodocola sp. TaxID=3073577 RepID=UPI003D7C7166
MKFSVESPFFSFLATLTDFVVLNLVFLITCLPIFTIGPALCALFAVTLREVRKESGYLIRSYVQAFRENFRRGLMLSLCYVPIGLILLYNLFFWAQLPGIIGTAATLILTLAVLIYLFSLFYVFALCARYENSLKLSIQNSVALSLGHPRQTLTIALILAAAGFFCIMPLFRVLMLLFGFAFLAYCTSFPLTRVFSYYETSESNPAKAAFDETDSDEA